MVRKKKVMFFVVSCVILFLDDIYFEVFVY